MRKKAQFVSGPFTNMMFEVIEKQKNDIIDSINYAKKIQKALLSIDLSKSKYLKNYFILYSIILYYIVLNFV